MKRVLRIASVVCAAWAPAAGQSGEGVPPVQIHLIHMGGNDCPPCTKWRALELPKLERSELFRTIEFSLVIKAIGSPVPARFFLPDNVKPLKDKLDIAGGGNRGSPQAALVVDGVVHDYWHGTRSALQIEAMIASIRNRTPYPETRCVRRSKGWGCEEAG